MGNVECSSKFLKFNPFSFFFFLFLLSLTSCPGMRDIEFSSKLLKFTHFRFNLFRLSLISCPGVTDARVFDKLLKFTPCSLSFCFLRHEHRVQGWDVLDFLTRVQNLSYFHFSCVSFVLNIMS